MSRDGRYRREADPEGTAARTKSYVWPAIFVMFLYGLAWVPGLIANILFYREVMDRQRVAGRTLPGVGCLTALLGFPVFSFITGVGIMLLVVFLL